MCANSGYHSSLCGPHSLLLPREGPGGPCEGRLESLSPPLVFLNRPHPAPPLPSLAVVHPTCHAFRRGCDFRASLLLRCLVAVPAGHCTPHLWGSRRCSVGEGHTL